MPDPKASRLPTPTPEQRRIAAGQFERANQVIATGDFDYGIRLLLSSCKLEPSNLIYRQKLRAIEKAKFKNNLRGSRLSGLTSMTTRAKLKAAKRTGDYVKVLEHAELVLARNPWDVGVQTDMADAAEALGLLDLAIWTLEQARQKDPRDANLNRALARLYEKRGNYTHAIALWELVRRAVPTDAEAQTKAKDLAAHETITRGQYEQAVGGQGSARVAGPAEQESGTHTAAPSTNTGPAPQTAITPRGRVPEPAVKEPSPLAPREPVASIPGLASSGARFSTEAAKLQARIDADPTNANAYLHLAGHYRRAGHIDEARAVLEQGLGPTGNHFDLVLELTDVQIEPFRRNLAVAEEKLRTHPNDEEVRKVRIRLLKEINTRELDLFRRKADRFPTEMNHRLELGVRLLRAGQVDEAIRELQAARTDPRQHWRALLYLGYCFKSRNNWRLAKRNYEEALQALPPAEDAVRKEVLFQLAQGSAEAGDFAAAVDLGMELANLDFAYRDIGQLLDGWQNRLQQSKVATDK
ncbi:MAG TPA: tetratricopeptide repeat protein [Gemmataceae bacterium]|nr:tetratricopeptide repeat protein [Gemmataceae bacterium]